MKAAALCVDERVRFVDLSHGVSPGAIRTAAWMLAKAFDLFPIGTCHVAVVDPGVGTDRRGLAASAGGHLFVGPDNGVLAPALAVAGEAEIREITVRDVDRPRRGTTFDGRDVFAPVAAAIAAGTPLEALGPTRDDFVRLDMPAPVRDGKALRGSVIYVDHFGNLVTSLPASRLPSGDVAVQIGDMRIVGVSPSYSAVESGELVAVIASWGLLEIAVRDGSARERLGASVGDPVVVQEDR
jgi:S-adenosylmethionine hydrolase